MKKIIAFILATVMLMATLTACGSKNNDDKKGGAKTAAGPALVDDRQLMSPPSASMPSVAMTSSWPPAPSLTRLPPA